MGDNTLRELTYGKGAHVDPVACIEDISTELATRTVAGYPHSIWQIVEHMNYWMEYDLGKIAGEPRLYPDQAIESWPAHPSSAADGRGVEDAWQATTRRFTDLLVRLARLAESDAAELERTVHNVGAPVFRGNPPCMPCCGKWRRTTVITRARLHCSGASLARGLRHEAAIPGESCERSAGTVRAANCTERVVMPVT